MHDVGRLCMLTLSNQSHDGTLVLEVSFANNLLNEMTPDDGPL